MRKLLSRIFEWLFVCPACHHLDYRHLGGRMTKKGNNCPACLDCASNSLLKLQQSMREINEEMVEDFTKKDEEANRPAQ